ncbi:hypothetical protein Taro_040964 [Colocasia esculenta]|uniref:Pseudouridine synthase I TruA alpha/beta domain-containing protein n=1 Tax=Colocasia esculenta TaxID=4460 RepID=A0A843WW09_COLES|nr:hypothetical protein [Colocasia esculenta]
MASPPPPSSSPAPPTKKLKMSSTTTSDGEEDYHDGAGEAPPLLPLSSSAGGEPKRRYKRRKVAIFLAYCGAGYQGMQKNPGAKTIEGDLEEAFFHAGGVPDHDRGKPRRYDWARAARTDKGVSAAGQVVSGRFYVDPPGFVDRLNTILSPQIRVFGYRRVTASFNAKKFCDRRRYVYLLPVFALDPNAHPDRESVIASLGSQNELAKCLECSERGRKVAGLVGRQGSNPCGEEQRTHLGPVDEEIKPGGHSKSQLVANSESSDTTVDSVGHGKATEKGTFAMEEDEKKSEITNGSEELKTVLGNGDLGSGEANVAAPACLESEPMVLPEVSAAEATPKGGDVGSEVRPEPPLHEEEGKATPAAEEPEPTPADDRNTETRASKEEEATAGAPLITCGNGEGAAARAGEFKYGEKEKARFNAILGRYVGTHNFHNFTTRTKAEDPSARRYIISFDANAVVEMGGIEFVRCEVVGQSFMLHQIRKMIGLAVAIMRNCSPESIMNTALRKDVNINVPTAPEVGLYLDECLFTSYNQKWRDSHEAVSMEAYAEQAEDFRQKHIFSHIAAMEHKEGAVALWLHSLNHRNYPDFRPEDAGGGSKKAEEVSAQTGGIIEVRMS